MVVVVDPPVVVPVVVPVSARAVRRDRVAAGAAAASATSWANSSAIPGVPGTIRSSVTASMSPSPATPPVRGVARRGGTDEAAAAALQFGADRPGLTTGPDFDLRSVDRMKANCRQGTKGGQRLAP